MVADPDFVARTTGVAEEITPQTASDFGLLVSKMAALTPEAEQFLKDLSRRHGLNIQ
jgi:hypothetical protein